MTYMNPKRSKSAPQATPDGAPTRVIRDKPFAQRLAQACDLNNTVPPYNFGRLTWIRDQLEEQYNESVSVETVRKWFAGEAKPRPNKLSKLASLLAVDEAWLSLGMSPEMTVRDRKSFSLKATGAVNLVAGLIQLSGGTPAFPEDGDPRMKNANLSAVIEGKNHAFYVTLAAPAQGAFKFAVPADHQHSTVIGVVHTGPLSCDFIHLTPDKLTKHGVGKGSFSEVHVKKTNGVYKTGHDQWSSIRSFAESF